LNILIVSQYFWPENFRINDVVKTLTEKGHIVDVLTGKPNYPDGDIFSDYSVWGTSKEVWNNSTLYRIPLIPRGKKSTLRLIANYLSFVIFGVLLGPWLLRKKRYDVIFVYGVSPILKAIPAIFLSWFKKCPSVIWVQDLWPESLEATGYVQNKHILGVVGSLVRWIYRHVDLLLVQSHAFVKQVSQMSANIPVLYYPNSVDTSFSKPANILVRESSILDNGFSILFAGNVGTAQAVETIVEAANLLKEYQDINFVILGSGSRLEWMKEQVIQRQLKNLHLLGRFPVETMPTFMQKASSLLVSLTEQPIFTMTVPNKVQAYMASGKPILACLNGEGARVVTEAKAGISISAEDAHGLADAILKLYQMSDQQRDEIGENGRCYYKTHYDHEMLVEQLIEHFKNASDLYKRPK